MDASYLRVKKTLQIGLGVSGASSLLAVVFLPSLILAAAALIATAVMATTFSGISTHKWALTWTAGIASVVWVYSALSTLDSWGQGFDLSDANQPVPPVLDYMMMGTFILSIAAFITILATAVFSAVQTRRLDPSHGIRPDAYPTGATS